MASLFSSIIAGTIPASFVFQDALWVGILDLYPVRPGHLLLIPRHEAPLIEALPLETLQQLGLYLRSGTRCLRRALGCPSVAVLVRDGREAGQEIPHVHIHLIPCYPGDDPRVLRGGTYGDTPDAVQTAINAMADQLRTAWQALG